MDILSQNCIHIDSFKLSPKAYACAKIFFLSHVHSDHTGPSLSKFTKPIYCSSFSADWLEQAHPEVDIVVVHRNKWYQENGVSFYVFNTKHSPGSLGLYFQEWDILYLGDTRVTHTMSCLVSCLKPEHIIVDHLFSEWKTSIPSFRESCSLLWLALDLQKKRGSKPVRLGLPHLSSILLLKSCNLRVGIEETTLKPMVRFGIDKLGLVDTSPKPEVVAVGLTAHHIDVLPSSMYFIKYDENPFNIIEDRDQRHMLRVFASFHVSHAECRKLRRKTRNLHCTARETIVPHH